MATCRCDVITAEKCTKLSHYQLKAAPTTTTTTAADINDHEIPLI